MPSWKRYDESPLWCELESKTKNEYMYGEFAERRSCKNFAIVAIPRTYANNASRRIPKEEIYCADHHLAYIPGILGNSAIWTPRTGLPILKKNWLGESYDGFIGM